MRNACRRPLMSEIKFITIRPVNEPIGKNAWISTRAQPRSQYKPIDDVIVNWSTLDNLSGTKCAFVDHFTCFILPHYFISTALTVEDRVHVQERRAEEYKHHGDPCCYKQSNHSFLIFMFTACEL